MLLQPCVQPAPGRAPCGKTPARDGSPRPDPGGEAARQARHRCRPPGRRPHLPPSSYPQASACWASRAIFTAQRLRFPRNMHKSVLLLCTQTSLYQKLHARGGGGGGEIKKKVIGHPNGILKYQTGKTVPVQAQQIPAQLHRSLILLWVGSTRRLSHAEGLRPSSCASRTDTASGLNPSLYYALNPSFFNSVLPEFPSFFSPLNTSFPCTQISTLGSVAFPALERDQFPKPQRQQRTLCFGAGVSPGHSSTALRTLASVQIGSMC